MVEAEETVSLPIPLARTSDPMTSFQGEERDE
jgi:hypothetical protein